MKNQILGALLISKVLFDETFRIELYKNRDICCQVLPPGWTLYGDVASHFVLFIVVICNCKMFFKFEYLLNVQTI